MSVQVVPGSGRAMLGEGPLWSERLNAVFWVDILGQQLHRLELGGGEVSIWRVPEPIGWVIERANHAGFIAGLKSGFAELDVEPFGLRPFLNPEPGTSGNRMNDAKADPLGRIWAGTMAFAGDGDAGAFYRLDPDRTCTLVDGPYHVPNGPAIAPDGSWLLHTDSARRTVYRFEINDDGSLGPRREHIVFAPDWGHPDGMTFDADGCLWVAHWGAGQLSRFDPAGRRIRIVDLPTAKITSCTFAGAALDRLFVTSAAQGSDDELAGALFEVEPGCHGLPTQRFGG